MTTVINTHEAVVEYLKDLSNSDLVYAHNQYCENCNDNDDSIYANDDEFFEVFFTKPLEAIRAAFYGDYRYSDDWVMFNGYANLESFNDPSDHVDYDAIADDILENPRDYNIDLEEPEEDEESAK